jgi:exodeoxyribonuclease V alpha subunit
MKAVSLLQRPEFSDLDRHFAAFVARFGGDERLVQWAAATLSKSVRDGHTCITLESISSPVHVPADELEILHLPAAAAWKNELEKSAAVGPPEAETPLVLDEAGRLYLRRYWNYQQRLATALREKCRRNPRVERPAGATQEDALEIALRHELTIICGGPGTGKTSTAVRLLERFLRAHGADRPRVALTAPTGKAASRLEEAVREAALRLPEGDPIRALMPPAAKTIHRLLGSKGRSTSFRHHAENPLPLDLLIVDEASMVALALLAKLFEALPANCRVLLLGDPDQLASVEPGAVLADIVDAARARESPLRGSVVILQKNYRFGDESGVQRACGAVRQGDAEGVLAFLRGTGPSDLVATEVSSVAELNRHAAAAVTAGFGDAASERDPATALAKLRNFRVLAALRRGPWGVAGLNRAVIRELATAGLIPDRAGAHYPGRPILILQNDYELDLYNGDLGVLLPDPAGGSGSAEELYAWFFGQDNNVRRVALARLPAHETAYAMTVHKSQGSEFERVLFVLPESDSPVLTRELIYTALTRARSGVQLCWNEPVLRAAVARRAQRESGLRDLLAAPLQPSAAR